PRTHRARRTPTPCPHCCRRWRGRSDPRGPREGRARHGYDHDVERMTGLDAAFLALETPSNHMHLVAVAVLDPTDVPGGFTAETLKELIARRLDSLPPFRRRVVRVPLGIHHPLWVEDPEFDLDFHVRQVAIPGPGGPRELAAFV